MTPFPKIEFKHTSTKETENIIKSLKRKISNGYDEISVKILKISAPFIWSPLTYICNRSLSTGVFLAWLKYSEIKPLFKNGDKTNTTNYSPISLLTSFSNLLKRLYMQDFTNILANEQCGFRNNSSTGTALYKLLKY
jgi:hypothetical protein